MESTNVGVIQPSHYLRLTLEPLRPNRIFRKLLGQDFDCDGTVQTGVVCAINFAHSASAERRHNFIGAEFCTRSQRHNSGGIITPEGLVWNLLALPPPYNA